MSVLNQRGGMRYLERFLIRPGAAIRLADIDPDFTDRHKSHDAARDALKHNAKRLSELQELLYAEHKRALLICLQGIDASGKDGTINHVLGAMNPQGCKVFSFKEPDRVERDHDFLWR